MADKVFINGRAAVHKGSAGKSVAFPDVCLCPPSPPAGPIPTPLPNTVRAADLTGAANSVVIEGNPAGHRGSYFSKSTGNEASRPTGGGVVTHGVQGKAHWGSFSMNVFFEGEPAVRHMDLLTHNHVAQPGNTPPAVWVSTVDPKPVAPKTVTKKVGDGPDWLEISLQDQERQPRGNTRYRLTLSNGRVIEGVVPLGGIVRVTGIPKGEHEVIFPDLGER
jgi:hypothetical protein